MNSGLPKLSYVLLSHNREKYIRAAIESAFAQDYEGELEYIFSDDCSTDRTFEIIKECVANYKGNRRVVVTQTPRNLHLAGNTNHAVQFVESDWVIRADDDDISHVSRCSIIGDAISRHPSASSVFVRFMEFYDKDEGEIIRLSQSRNQNTPAIQIFEQNNINHIMALFSSPNYLHQTWATRCYREFGELPLNGYYVDDVISNFRALALGCCIDVNAECAYIRQQSGNMSWGVKDAKSYKSIIELEKFNDKYFNTVITPLRETYAALTSYFGEDVAERQPLLHEIEKMIGNCEIQKDYWRRGTLYRFQIKKQYELKGFFSWVRCLPLPIFAFIVSSYRMLFKRT